jgi:hypothetical protein
MFLLATVGSKEKSEIWTDRNSETKATYTIYFINCMRFPSAASCLSKLEEYYCIPTYKLQSYTATK